MNQKSYAKLVEWENEQLIDERDKKRKMESERRQAGSREEGQAMQDRDRKKNGRMLFNLQNQCRFEMD